MVVAVNPHVAEDAHRALVRIADEQTDPVTNYIALPSLREALTAWLDEKDALRAVSAVDNISAQLVDSSSGLLSQSKLVDAMAKAAKAKDPLLGIDNRVRAAQMVKSFDRARRPMASRALQLGLFYPKWLIPVATNVRVWMEKATREDFVQWVAITTREYAIAVAAHLTIAEYQAERLSKWTADERWLVDVERRYFDYQDGVVDADDAPSDEDDAAP